MKPPPSDTFDQRFFPELFAAAQRAQAASQSVVAMVTDDAHPTLQGRVRVRVDAEEATAVPVEGWVPTLMNLPVRTGDRVLLLLPKHAREPVIVGVIDGFARRPEATKQGAARIALRRDEKLCIVGSRGTPLVEVFEAEDGPVVRFLHTTARMAVDGALDVEADTLRLRARNGPIELDATDDVVVRGEVIRLN